MIEKGFFSFVFNKEIFLILTFIYVNIKEMGVNVVLIALLQTLFTCLRLMSIGFVNAPNFLGQCDDIIQ